MGINNYYFNKIDGEIILDNYWDFHITDDNQGMSLPYSTKCGDSCGIGLITDNDLVLWLDISKTGTTTDGTILTSLTEWTGSTITPTSGMTLCNFGITGVDNGRVSGLTDTIILTSGDTKIKLYPVTGLTYNYPWLFNTGSTLSLGCDIEETICLNGGFYQGFFKIDFEKPSPVSSSTITINSCGDTGTTITVLEGDPDEKKYEIFPTTFEKGWTMETWLKTDNTICSEITGLTLNQIYPDNEGFFFYIGTRSENKFWNTFSGESGYTTCNGIPLDPDVEVDTGNNGGQDWFSRSQYGFSYPWSFSSCCCEITDSTGTSVTTGNTYNHCNDLGENALGFRITPENKLGWRKLTVTGECRNNKQVITGTTVEEEYTEFSVIPMGNTATLIQVTYIQGSGEKFGLPTGTLKMYVNGRLVLRSEDFIGLQLRPLNTWSEKQEGVPFNISWGGGTQGLLESQTYNGPDSDDLNMIIERNFAGTFNGELSQLRFYKRPLNILELRNNMYVECNRYCVRTTFGGSTIVQPGSNLCGDCLSNDTTSYLLDDGCYLITENGEKIQL